MVETVAFTYIVSCGGALIRRDVIEAIIINVAFAHCLMWWCIN